MNRFFRVVGNGVWACAFGLSVWLAFELHEYKFDIALGVALLSLALSAIGLLLARVAGKQGDRLGMRIGFVIWMAGAVSFSLTELGFWYGSYKDRHAEYVQVKTTKERQAGLKDMAWDALKTGEVRTTAAELTARMKAARQSELWSSSSGCEKTTPKTRAFCQGYFEFEAGLAKANKLETIEAEFLAEKPAATRKTAHSIFTTADLLAENTGLSERTASVVVILVIALVLMLSRDLLPIVANPIGRAVAASGAAKPSEGSVTPAITVVAPPAPAPRAEPWASEEELKKLRDLVAEMRAANLPENPVSSNPLEIPMSSPAADEGCGGNLPTGPGTPVAKPEEPATEDAEDAKIVRPAQWHDESVPPVAPRTNGKRSKRNLTRKDQIVIQWLADSCSITGDERDLTTGAACHASYKQYCKGRGIPEHDWVAKARMSTILSGHLGTRVEGGRGKRTNQGAVFTGLLINSTVAQKRRVAA